MRTLSKSKLIAWRQCPKRMWLEIHHPELRQDSADTQNSYAVGNQVGEIARQIYDPNGKGILLNAQVDGYDETLARTAELLQSGKMFFEGGFRAGGAQAFADVMLPATRKGQRVWRMVEVKSSTEVKDYHRDDVAIQSFVARAAGVPLLSVELAHIDGTWVYPGDGDYSGLLVAEDLTDEAASRDDEVKSWIAAAQAIAAQNTEPEICTGAQCADPYNCGFIAHCQAQEPQAEYPVSWLPRMDKALKGAIASEHWRDLREVPDKLLNEKQQRVKTATLTGKTWFDKAGAAKELSAHKLPAYFLDFETTMSAVPIWKGTRPYQHIPFQFSVHRLSRSGKLESDAFLDLSGKDPSRKLAEALLAACGEHGPIFTYKMQFEKGRITELAERFPRLKKALLALTERLVDLLPIAENHYYHPSQRGSWSIKAVLPAICPDMDYADLEGVQHGGMAMDAYREAIAPETSPARKAEIETQLLVYCEMDTLAMVRLWEFFR